MLGHKIQINSELFSVLFPIFITPSLLVSLSSNSRCLLVPMEHSINLVFLAVKCDYRHIEVAIAFGLPSETHVH